MSTFENKVDWFDEVLQYEEKILSGKWIACEPLKLAVAKYKKEREEDKSDLYYFDKAYGNNFIWFVHEYCKHAKGELTGQPIVLELWQIYIFYTFMAWRCRDKSLYPRFRNLLLLVGRKQGKSLLIGNLVAHRMHSRYNLECYSSSLKRDQSAILYDLIKAQILKSPHLAENIQIKNDGLYSRKTETFFKPLSRDAGQTLLGTNPNGLICWDEASVYSSRDTISALTTGMVSRMGQNVFLSTAGPDRTSHFYTLLKSAEDDLKYEDELSTTMCAIYRFDDGDEEKWDVPSDEPLDLYYKSNPNLHVSMPEIYLREQIKSARQSKMDLSDLLLYHANVFCSVGSAWDAADAVYENVIEELPKRGYQSTIVSVDLALGTDGGDLTSFNFSHLYSDGKRYHQNVCYYPHASFEKIPKRLRPIYDDALDKSELIIMGDTQICFDDVFDDVIKRMDKLNVDIIRYDPQFASGLLSRFVKAGYNILGVKQSHFSFTGREQEARRNIIDGNYKFLNNKLFLHSVDNLRIHKSGRGAGNASNKYIYPDTPSSVLKNDPIIALITGVLPEDYAEYKDNYGGNPFIFH